MSIPPVTANIPDSRRLFSNSGVGATCLRHRCVRRNGLDRTRLVEVLRVNARVLTGRTGLLVSTTPVIVYKSVRNRFCSLVGLFRITKKRPPTGGFLFLKSCISHKCFSLRYFICLLTLGVGCPRTILVLQKGRRYQGLAGRFAFGLRYACGYDLTICGTYVRTFSTLPLTTIVGKRCFYIRNNVSPTLGEIRSIGSVSQIRRPPGSNLVYSLL